MRSGGQKARIAVIPGDGIGAEVTPQAVKVLQAVSRSADRELEFVEFDWGAEKYLREGVTLPSGAVELLRDEFDAILFGALGDPRVPSNQHGADILLGLRFKLDLYVNARPVELLHERQVQRHDLRAWSMATRLQGSPPGICGHRVAPSLYRHAGDGNGAGSAAVRRHCHLQPLWRHPQRPGSTACWRAGPGTFGEHPSGQDLSV